MLKFTNVKNYTDSFINAFKLVYYAFYASQAHTIFNKFKGGQKFGQYFYPFSIW